MNNKEFYRNKIDEIDEKIIALLAERRGAALKIEELKRIAGEEIVDEKREKQKIKMILLTATENCDNAIFAEFIQSVFLTIIQYCRVAQEKQKLNAEIV